MGVEALGVEEGEPNAQRPTPNALHRFWPLLFLLLVPLIHLYRAIFSGEAIGAHDQIRQMAPWNGPPPSQPWDVLQADGVLQFYPWRDLVLDAWGKGQLPLWNPYELAGTPLLANSQSAGFYPPHIVLGLLRVPTATAMTLLALFHLFWAGLGVYRLVRELGGTKLGGAVGAASFASSAFMLAWTPLASVISTVAWVPWALACVFAIFRLHPGRLVEDGRPTEQQLAAAVRGRRGSTTALAASVGMMLLAGHLQFAAYGLLAVGIVTLWLAVQPKRKRENDVALTILRDDGLVTPASLAVGRAARVFFSPKLGSSLRCLLALVLGVGLAAPQLLPVLDYGQYSHRRGAPTEEGYRAYVGSALRPVELVGLVYPGAVGLPHRFSAVEQGVSEYWPAVVKQGGNFAESAFAVGPLLPALTVLGCPFILRRGRSAAIQGLALIALLLALGTPLNRLLYFYFPGWSATGSPGRVGFLIVLGACVVGGLGVREEFFRDGARVRRALIVALGSCAVLLALLGSVWPSLAAGGAPPQMQEAVQRYVLATIRANLPLMLLATLLVPGVFWAWRRDSRLGAGTLLGAAVLIPLLLHGGLVRTGEPLPRPAANPSSTGRVAIVNGAWDLIQPVKALLPPNTATLGRAHELGGYDSLLHRDTVAMLRDVNGQDPAPPANGNMMFVKASADPAKLAAAGVTEVWSLRPLPQLGEPAFAEGGFLRYPVAGPGRASVAGGRAQIVVDGYDRQTIRTEGEGGLVVRDRNMPGWEASVDGRAAPVMKGSLWREVGLTAGQHEVEFRYVPPGLMPGAILGGVAWLLLLALALTAWRAGRRAEPGAAPPSEAIA